MESKENVQRRNLEESGEVLREHEGHPKQSNDDNSSQNKWEEAMKDVPSYEEHMEQDGRKGNVNVTVAVKIPRFTEEESHDAED
jgi:hypothetical protein